MAEIKKDISIIIPCYNTKAEYLQEAVDSVQAYTGKFSYEIIITDDGSVNEETICLLRELSKQQITIIYQKNQGPSVARNNAVNNCNGDYILCLDSDNKIKSGYIDEGVEALQKNPKAGVVYANPKFIGETGRPYFKTSPFNIEKLLVENYIDMCTVIRKKAWDDVGGLDECLLQHEDWELWLNFYKKGWHFIYLDKILFEYRIRTGSLITQASENGYKKIIAYIYKKHWDLVYDVFHKLYSKSIMYKNDMQKPFRSFLKYSKKKFIT